MEAIHSEFNLDEESLHISLIGTNLFTLHFQLHEEQKRILDQQPWQISGLLLVLKEIQENQNPRYIELSQVPIWFNFSGLYFEHYDQDTIRDIAKAVGTVLCVEPKQGIPSAEEGFRARVNVHVLLPLPKGTLVRTAKDGLVWVSIIPEFTLLNFCKNCLVLGHVYSECNTHFYHLLPSLSDDDYYYPVIKTEAESSRSFYEDPDPRFIHSYSPKSGLIDPYVSPSEGSRKKPKLFNNAVQFAASVIVNFIEGKGPAPTTRVITEEMMKQVVDYLLSLAGELLLQRVSPVLVMLVDDHIAQTTQLGVERRVLSQRLNRHFAAAGVFLSDSSQVGDSNIQKTIKEEYEEYPFQIDSGNSWIDW
ncbi:hypothetical protein ACHQM5_006460 [Ranunculus cassubicifolius]